MRKLTNSKKSVVVLIGAVALTAGVGTGLAANASTVDAASEQVLSNEGANFVAADYALVALESPVSSERTFPELIDTAGLGVGGISVDGLRYVGENESAEHWTGLDSQGNLCLVSVLVGPGNMAAAACDNPENFADHGLGLQAGNEEVSAEVYLIPDSSVPAGRNARAAVVTQNLYIADPLAAGEEREAFAEALGDATRVFAGPIVLED